MVCAVLINFFNSREMKTGTRGMLGQRSQRVPKTDPGFLLVFLCNLSRNSNCFRGTSYVVICESHVITKPAQGHARNEIMVNSESPTPFFYQFFLLSFRVSRTVYVVFRFY